MLKDYRVSDREDIEMSDRKTDEGSEEVCKNKYRFALLRSEEMAGRSYK